MKLRVLFAAFALLVAGACGTATDEAQVDTDVDGIVEPLVSQTATGKTVRLLDLGAEPRSELRTSATPGDTRRIGLTLGMSQSIDLGGTSQEVATPTSITVTDYVVDAVDGDRFTLGSVIVRQEIVDPAGADPAVIAQTIDLQQRFAGLTGTLVTDAQMDIIESEVGDLDLGPEFEAIIGTLLDSIDEQASNLAQPFPPQAVGIGAVWEVVSSSEISGIAIETVTTYTLTERTDTSARAEVAQTLTFVPGPATINGIDAEVIGGSSNGAGFIVWDLTFPLPIGGDITSTGTFEIEAQGQSVTVSQTQRFTTAIVE